MLSVNPHFCWLQVPHSVPSWCVWTTTGQTTMAPGQKTPLSTVLGTIVGAPMFWSKAWVSALRDDHWLGHTLPNICCQAWLLSKLTCGGTDAVTDEKLPCWGGRQLFSRRPWAQAATEDQLAAPLPPPGQCSLTHAWSTAADQMRGAAAAGRSGAANMTNLQPCSAQAAATLLPAARFPLQVRQERIPL